MNVLALFDVHGNPAALEAVLADPRAADPDAVVVGGDVVPGPACAPVLARLRALEVPTHWVRGNGERVLAEAAAAGSGFASDDLAAPLAPVSLAEVGEAEARALGALPLTVEVDGVLFCHASPRRDDELLTRLSSDDRWAAALDGVQAPLVVAGHTHQQDDRTVGPVRVVNAGSVGLPFEGDGAARWVWVQDGVPSLRHTPYDHVAAGRRMLAGGWPDERSVTGALLDPVDPLMITRLFEGLAAGG